MSRTSILSHRSLLASLVLMLGWIFLLQACGGGGGGGGGPSTFQMGGARQGIVLNLTTAVTSLAGAAGTSDITDSTDGTGATARFGTDAPAGVTTDGTYLYAADYSNHTIRRIVISTGNTTTLAGSAGVSGTSNSTDGTGGTARFNRSEGITTDGTNLYVADTLNHTIRRVVIATGDTTTLAGAAGTIGTSDSTDGTGSTARFNTPTRITTDGTYLYVADSLNHTIRRVVIATGATTTLAGSAGVSGTSNSTDGTGGTARFNTPNGITTDGTNLYVTDTLNHTIRRVVIATGATTTLAGAAGTIGTSDSTDGTGSTARFNSPFALTTDGTNLYVTDTNNHTIRRVAISTGATVTLAGLAGAFGTSDGIGATARFIGPWGITTDGQRLLIGENARVRVLQ